MNTICDIDKLRYFNYASAVFVRIYGGQRVTTSRFLRVSRLGPLKMSNRTHPTMYIAVHWYTTNVVTIFLTGEQLFSKIIIE